MRHILLLLFVLNIVSMAKPLNEDIHLYFDKDKHILSFGGVSTPLCRIKLSDDNQQLKYIGMDCKQTTNSKGIQIICNSNKSVCKTKNELIDYLNFQ